VAVDSQWGNVVLLLPMEGANNQTIITDVKGHVVTTNGGAKLTTAQAPTGCTTSLVLDGNNDYLTLSGADLALGGSDWAIEFPVWRAGDTAAGTANAGCILDFRTDEPQISILLELCGSTSATPNKIDVWINGAVRITSTNALTAAFKLVTLAKISGTLRLFFDGTQEGSSYADGNTYSTTTLTVGGRYAAIGGDYRSLNGYLGPVRITKGNGRGYSTTFTPPTLPYPRPTISGITYSAAGSPTAKTVLVAKRSTQVLLGGANSDPSTGVYSFNPPDFSECTVSCIDEVADPYQSSVLFADRLNASGFPTLTGQTITVNGTVTASAALADPFGGSQPSALFNGGTGDYLVSSGTLAPGAVYTVSGWFRTTSLTNPQGIFFFGTHASDNNRVQLAVDNTGLVNFFGYSTGNLFNINSAGGVIATNTWYHFAAVRNGTNVYAFIGGVLVASGVVSGTESTGSILHLGYCRYGAADRGCPGRLFDVRYSNRAEYLAPFTPPTAFSQAAFADGGSAGFAEIRDRVVPG